jgi:peptidoglycan-associated lipoprotein
MFGKRTLATLAAVLMVAACSRKPEPQQPTPEPTPTADTPTPTPAPPENRASGPDPAAVAATVRASLAEMVFFDYDQSSIREDARSVLDRKVSILRVNPGAALRIEGHADERGSVEYNLALSLRRANAIRDYMANFGIEGSRFEVAPIGEERPLSMGTSEADYARNRRGEFHITRGGDNLVPPR